VVVDQVDAGEEVKGWVMETDETVTIIASEMVLLGHKLALKDIGVGDTIYKYGQDVGKAVGNISQGGHVHVQNVKTKRW
jgi:(2R)-sulfolactate sulfo-lyase subunit alpha